MEAALVIPLFVYATVAVIFMLHVLMVRTQVNNALYNTVRKINRYAYISESVQELSDEDKNDIFNNLKKSEDDAGICRKVITNVELVAVFIDEIGGSYAKDNYITGGNAGWVFAGTKVLDNGSTIEVKLTYRIYNPFNIFGKQGIYIHEHCLTDAWLGEDRNTYVPSEYNQGDMYVYVTENGQVFHTDIDCTYLLHQIRTASINDVSQLRNDAGAKYYKCSKCDEKSDTIYYTPYGRRYHTTSTCEVLQRNVTSIKREIAEKTMRCCIKCAENNG